MENNSWQKTITKFLCTLNTLCQRVVYCWILFFHSGFSFVLSLILCVWNHYLHFRVWSLLNYFRFSFIFLVVVRAIRWLLQRERAFFTIAWGPQIDIEIGSYHNNASRKRHPIQRYLPINLLFSLTGSRYTTTIYVQPYYFGFSNKILIAKSFSQAHRIVIHKNTQTAIDRADSQSIDRKQSQSFILCDANTVCA